MGCNFFTLTGKHIGKRSAAGLYCWDCGISFNPNLVNRVQCNNSKPLKECPKCGKPAKKEDLFCSSAGRELGFNKQEPSSKTGVASCSAFTWAVNPDKIKKTIFVKDEYGSVYSGTFFRNNILAECPIQFFDRIGIKFG